MIVETIFGIVLSVMSPNDAPSDPATMVLKGITTGTKIIEKTEKEEWGPSLHEEIYLLTKDSIYKLGGLK
jgi:hypothetical protein